MPHSDDPNLYMYRIDKDDVIRKVNEAWDDFAIRNGAPELLSDNVIGRPIWDYINGSSIQLHYRELFEAIRKKQGQTFIHLKCDSPELERECELYIKYAPDGGLAFAGRFLTIRRREPIPILERGRPKSDEVAVVCSWCKRIRRDEQEWLGARQAMNDMEMFKDGRMPRLSHGICPDCNRKIAAQIERVGSV